MARLLALPRDPERRIVCSDCMKRNQRSVSDQYLFEFADHVTYDADEFQLYGEVGALQRKPLHGPAAIHMLMVPADAVLLCRSCQHAAAAQRIEGTLLQRGRTIEGLRAFSATTGEEVDVPPGRFKE